MSSDEFVGWHLQEAIRRTVDPALLSRFIAGLKEQRPSAPNRLVDSFPKRTGKSDCGSTLQGQVIAEFRNHLISGRLVAYGRVSKRSTDVMPIASSDWKELEFEDCRRSIVREGSVRVRAITHVRVFPVLYAHDLLERLDGMPLVQAFRDFVFGDPQLLCLQKRPVRFGGEHRRLSHISRLYHAYWDVRHGEVPVRGSMGYLLDARDGSAAHHANEVLRLRFGRIIRLLQEGALLAEGASRTDGSRIPIPAAMWVRPNAYLDLISGDYFDCFPDKPGDHGNNVVPLYLGVTFRRQAAQPLHVKHIQPHAARSSPTTSANAGKGLVGAAERQRTESECKAWLVGLMKASPDHRIHTNEWLLDEARRRWSDISARSFVAARKAAISETGAVAWAAAGASRKS